jgi:uncharacterized protein YjbJ (UPF0337 family)
MELCPEVIPLQQILITMSEKKEAHVAEPAKGVWSEQKGKLKAKFANLTDADLQYEAGKKDEMLAKLQTKLGKSKVEFEAILANL